jgi:hypothetical protein
MYTWQERAFQSQNIWTSIPVHWRISQLWDNTVMAARAGPLNNFIQCRLNPTLQSLVAISLGEIPMPTLGEASLIPQDEAAQDMGGVRIVSTADTNTGTTEVAIPVAAQPSFSLIGRSQDSSETNSSGGPSARNFRGYADSYAGFYRGARHSGRHSGRHLSESGGSLQITSLEASCYAFIANSVGQRVGQVLGDCIVATPSEPLAGAFDLCVPIDAAIPVNPQFTEHVIAHLAADGTMSAMPNTVTVSTNGLEICSSVHKVGHTARAKHMP